MSPNPQLVKALARTTERASAQPGEEPQVCPRVVLKFSIFVGMALLGWLVVGYKLDSIAPQALLGAMCGTLTAVPALRAVQARVVPAPPGVFRVRHLVGLTTDSVAVFAGFVAGRCRHDLGPALVGLVGLAVGMATALRVLHGVAFAGLFVLAAILVAVVGGPCSKIDASACVAKMESRTLRLARAVVLILGIATSALVTAGYIEVGSALVIAGICTAATVLCGTRAVSTALTAVPLPIDKKANERNCVAALLNSAAARTVPMRVLIISLVRSGELRRWAMTSCLFAGFVLAWRVSPFEIDLVTVTGIFAALSMLGVAYSLRVPSINNSWALSFPGGVRRDLVSRILVGVLAAVPCWISLGILRILDGRAIDALMVLWVFAVCAMRAAAHAPRFADPNSNANELLFQLVQVLLGSISIALLDALSHVQSKGSVTAFCLMVIIMVLLPAGYMVRMWKRWGDGGADWKRIASLSSSVHSSEP
ncbi:hypothetical protein ACJEDT_13880 [Rhodococcoides fascians]|uniref:hypothetical protein n=1 Tax=Rhodococcoides fascians TaxID=1828 RepID=UPI000AA1F1CE|nr:hypothetical protein [Rhodococcus fascians]